jgi:hypothetical protein
MPTKAKLLIFPWIVAGMGLLVATVAWDFRFPEPARFVTCLALALLGSTFKIRLPRMQGTLSINFVLVLIAIAQMTLTEALVVGVSGTLVQCVWRTRTRPKLAQVLFNISTLTVSVILAFVVLDALRNSGALIPGLVVAAVLFFVVNSGLVSLVLALLNSQSAISIWRNCHRWAFPYYIGGAALAGLVTVYSEVCGWRLAFAMLPLMYMLYYCYESWIAAQAHDESPVTAG